MDLNESRAHEAALKLAVLAGDRDAFEVLCRPLLRPLYAYVLARSEGDEAFAEEVVQESWLIAVRKIRRFDPKLGSFESWVRGIAENVRLNAWRAKRRRTPTASVDPDSIPVSQEGPSRAEIRMTLALSGLPERYQSVLRARYHSGRSVKEIAELQGRSSKSIESLLARAREALKQAWIRLEISDCRGKS